MDPLAPIDPIALARALIRRPSVTPLDAGALDLLEETLKELGFVCHRLKFGEADNLCARLGDKAPHFCFAGHTDVVPAGQGWTREPFAADVHEGVLYGRGAADMKSAIAAMVAAVTRFLAKGTPKGSISFLIAGDEEGAADGTVNVLEWLKAQGQVIDHCVVGEPTSVAKAGDTLKIGRRGSINFRVMVKGVQGHVGYPQKARNPIPALADLITQLSGHRLDKGSDHFDPSTLAFTSADVGNPATNVIPESARAAFNIRFNDRHTPESLTGWVHDCATQVEGRTGCTVTVEAAVSGTAFLTPPGKFTQLVSDTVSGIIGQAPLLSTSGGTSDARFITHVCPVVELGLAGTTMHKSDESVPVAEINALTDIYAALLAAYFAKPPL
jgi:succinyl-diaminopimelate desuccinylase